MGPRACPFSRQLQHGLEAVPEFVDIGAQCYVLRVEDRGHVLDLHQGLAHFTLRRSAQILRRRGGLKGTAENADETVQQNHGGNAGVHYQQQC
jgi:hypothetical protein